MKKSLLPVLFIASFSVQSQQLQNSNFDTWSVQGSLFQYENPDGWNTLAGATSGVSSNHSKATGSDALSGNAIRLETKTLVGQTANGIVSNGTIVTTPPYGVSGGVAYAFRPDSIAGFYKAAPASGDFPTMELVLLDANADTLGWARFEAPSAPVTTYQRFSAPVVYTSTATPAKCIALFSSSNGFSAVNGSVLYVDEVSVIFNPTAVVETFTQTGLLNVFPNPSADYLTFNPTPGAKGTLSIIDTQGRLIAQTSLNGPYTLQTHHLEPGVYLYRLDQGENVEAGKFTVIR